MVQEYVTVKNQNYGQVEDVHMFLTHSVSQCFRQRIIDEGAGEDHLLGSIQRLSDGIPSYAVS